MDSWRPSSFPFRHPRIMKSRSSFPEDSPSSSGRSPWDSGRISLNGLFVLAMIYTIYFAKPVLLPLILSVLAAMILKPVQRFVMKSRMPAIPSALLVVMSVLGLMGTGLYHLQIPAAEWAQTVNPNIVKARVERFFLPLREFRSDLAEAAAKVEELTEVTPQKPDSDEEKKTNSEEAAAPPPVSVKLVSNPLPGVVAYAHSLTLHAASTLLLTLLFLAFGDALNRNISESVQDGVILQKIGRSISRYLFTITMINAGLGVVIGVAMALLGVPNPVLWGVMAALFNFIPYAGALAGTGVIFLVSVSTFTAPMAIALPPIVYFAVTAIEGNLVTPSVLGRRFTMNPIIIFLWFASWSILWGFPGMLIAMPLLMAFRIIAREVPSLWRFDLLINGSALGMGR